MSNIKPDDLKDGIFLNSFGDGYFFGDGNGNNSLKKDSSDGYGTGKDLVMVML
jgi:hypothetical protein